MATNRVTIKDISSTLGVSTAIINRALNNKPGVSKELKDKILKTADELGYRVNKVAQSMARSPIIIGVVIPREWAEYFDVLKDGIEKEFDRLLDYNVESRYYITNNIHSSRETINTLEQCIEDKVSGIILCDVFPTGLEKIMNKLKLSNIPIVMIGGTQNMNDNCLCSVQVDAYLSGMMAAEMLSFMTGDGGEEKDVVLFVGNKDNVEHKLKTNGFVDYAKTCNMNIIGIYETLDDDQIATQLAKKIMSEVNTIDGMYIATANSPAVCSVVEDNKYKTKIVSTDIYDKISEYIQKGIIQCTIFQDLEKHGRTAVKVIYEYLAEQKCPDKIMYIKPQIIIKSNLDSYFDKKNKKPIAN